MPPAGHSLEWFLPGRTLPSLATPLQETLPVIVFLSKPPRLQLFQKMESTADPSSPEDANPDAQAIGPQSSATAKFFSIPEMVHCLTAQLRPDRVCTPPPSTSSIPHL